MNIFLESHKNLLENPCSAEALPWLNIYFQSKSKLSNFVKKKI